MDSLCFADHTHCQDILHIFSSKQTVEPLLIEACGQDMLHEQFQFMGKITIRRDQIISAESEKVHCTT